jgi:NADPH2:quinone reductase
MTNAIVFEQTGGSDVLNWVSQTLSKPTAGEVHICHTAIGLDFIDVYHRTGLYPVPMPAVPGLGAAGVVVSVGEDVTAFKAGDRVAYPAGPMGSYAEERLIAASKLVHIPNGVSDEDAAALMLKGCTVEFLVERLFAVKPHHTVLLQAAAGGIGLIACQWLKSIGATIIGTVGSPEKAALAKENGCTHTVEYRNEDFEKVVMDITDGKGVEVVYDGLGAATFMKSLNCLKRRGMMVTFGNATGPVPEISPGILAQKGSVFLTRPTLMDYVATREDLEHSTKRVFDQIFSGVLRSNINQTFALKDAKAAHDALEGRNTSGQSILVP